MQNRIHNRRGVVGVAVAVLLAVAVVLLVLYSGGGHNRGRHLLGARPSGAAWAPRGLLTELSLGRPADNRRDASYMRE